MILVASLSGVRFGILPDRRLRIQWISVRETFLIGHLHDFAKKKQGKDITIVK
jgi:hypothetical protein